jgi:hypothetical protein
MFIAPRSEGSLAQHLASDHLAPDIPGVNSPVRWVKLWGKTYVETLVIGKRAVAPDTSKDEPITKSTSS